MSAAIQDKFADARKAMAAVLVERDDEIDMTLTALAAQEHVLLVGPPGTGKSLLLDTVMRWVDGAVKFDILMTKFTMPEETAGPVSVKGLKDDRFYRLLDGMMPAAHFVFLDEVFKANSAILNTFLKLMNERVYRNGTEGVVKCPLRGLVGASNEFPNEQEGGKELGALFDRFLFRKKVRPVVTAEGEDRLLGIPVLGGPAPDRTHHAKFRSLVTLAEIDQAAREAAALPFTRDAADAFKEIGRQLRKDGIVPGDRRRKKSVGAAQAFAYVSGADVVETSHLEVLAHTLWDDPAEQPEKVAKVVAKVANPTGMIVNSLRMEVEQIIGDTDVRDLKQAAAAASKLREVHKKLSGLKSDPRVERATSYVAAKIKEVKLASVESI